jgi:hypothetical protein
MRASGTSWWSPAARTPAIFCELLANGKQFGLKHIDYTYQEGEGGIADALALAEHFADGQKICVILGDNIIEGSIRKAADDFRQQAKGAKILLKEVPTPSVSAWPRSPAMWSISRRSPASEIQLRGHRHLYVRCHGVR